MYASLGIPVRNSTAPAVSSENGTNVRAAVDPSEGFGRIVVGRIGPQTVVEALQAFRDLLSARAPAIYVDLPLRDPRMPELCEKLEAAGCYFAGIGPWLLDGNDALRLQHVAVPLDLSKLSIFSDFGKELLDYIGRERDRTAGKRA
jgi:hypothetical protein